MTAFRPVSVALGGLPLTAYVPLDLEVDASLVAVACRPAASLLDLVTDALRTVLDATDATEDPPAALAEYTATVCDPLLRTVVGISGSRSSPDAPLVAAPGRRTWARAAIRADVERTQIALDGTGTRLLPLRKMDEKARIVLAVVIAATRHASSIDRCVADELRDWTESADADRHVVRDDGCDDAVH